jgi:hypothetical protein
VRSKSYLACRLLRTTLHRLTELLPTFTRFLTIIISVNNVSLLHDEEKGKKYVLRRINRLLSFRTTRSAQKTMFPTIIAAGTLYQVIA